MDVFEHNYLNHTDFFIILNQNIEFGNYILFDEYETTKIFFYYYQQPMNM